MRVLLILALCLAAVAAVPRNPQRIIGGSVVDISEYPSMVALLYSRFQIIYSQYCGGTILNTKAVLTAAHCTIGDLPQHWRVRVGSNFANSEGTVYSLNLIINHPEYNARTFDNDMAILHTSTSIVHSALGRPASIPGSNYILADNQPVWAVGWGNTSPTGSPSEQLRHVQIWAVNQDVCAQRYATGGYSITNNMLCSGWLDVGGRDQCQGDSGGPLYHNNVVVGVCSWGFGCADPFFPGVNARVSRYTSWIQANA